MEIRYRFVGEDSFFFCVCRFKCIGTRVKRYRWIQSIKNIKCRAEHIWTLGEGIESLFGFHIFPGRKKKKGLYTKLPIKRRPHPSVAGNCHENVRIYLKQIFVGLFIFISFFFFLTFWITLKWVASHILLT